MPPFVPIHRREVIAALRHLGFEGPYAGGKHEYMVKGASRVMIPNPHRGEIGREYLARLLRQAGISREEWEAI